MRALRWSSQAHSSLAALVGLAHHERLDPQRVLADDQVAHRLELVRAGQRDHVRRIAGALPLQPALVQSGLDRGGDGRSPQRSVQRRRAGRTGSPRGRGGGRHGRQR